MKVVLFIRSLDCGGAERQLVTLAKGLKAKGIDVHVLTFYDGGALRRDLLEGGIPVTNLGKRGRWDVVGFAVRLLRWLRRKHPDTLYAFLPVANILAALAKPFLPSTRIVWGVRASNMDLARYDWLSRLVARLEVSLSRLADVIIANSQAGRIHHVRLGFSARKILVIENGIDEQKFFFKPRERMRLRRAWGIQEGEFLIGMVARIDPMKGYEKFLEAAAIAAQENTRFRFVCVGEGDHEYWNVLKRKVAALGLTERLIWAGRRKDMAAVYSAFDVACSSSDGEGFSNAIAEAMACERVCVVTDVGDSARIVGDTGLVVPPRNPKALAEAWLKFATLTPVQRLDLGKRARTRIVRMFSVDRMVTRTKEVLGS